MAAQTTSQLQCSRSNKQKTIRLFSAIRRGDDLRTICALLQEGVDLDTTDYKNRTPLLLACTRRRKGIKEIVHLLIKAGSNVDSFDEDECTVLHYASQNGWTKIVRFLVKNVRDLNALDFRGETALHYASRKGRLKTVQCLVKKGADIDRMNLAGLTPLLCAAQYSKKGVFDQLLNSGANVDVNERLLIYYALRNSWKDTVKSFVNKISNVIERLVVDETILDATTSRGHLEIVECLVVKGTDNNRENEMICQEALYHASFMGHLDVVKWLLKKGGDIKIQLHLNVRHRSGYTALYLALLGEHLEVAKCLVEAGADINTKNYDGGAALHIESLNGHMEAVNWLVEKGADINIKTRTGFTPLFSAVVCNKKDIADFLIRSGANLDNLYDQNKWTILHVATFNGSIDIIQSLIKAGYDLDTRNFYGTTALGTACWKQQLEVARTLLQAGASWDVLQYQGSNSLLSYLIKREKLEFIKLFIDNGAYFKPVDYYDAMKNSSLEVLQDVKLCCRAIVNNFNNHDLPELYELIAPGCLPRKEVMAIASGSEITRAIEQSVGFDIQNKGHCNILEIRPMALRVFSVRSVLEFYRKRR